MVRYGIISRNTSRAPGNGSLRTPRRTRRESNPVRARIPTKRKQTGDDASNEVGARRVHAFALGEVATVPFLAGTRRPGGSHEHTSRSSLYFDSETPPCPSARAGGEGAYAGVFTPPPVRRRRYLPEAEAWRVHASLMPRCARFLEHVFFTLLIGM